MSKSHQKVVVGIAWFRKDQYQQLRMLSADRDQMAATYDEWQSEAEKAIPKLHSQGMEAQKVDVELKELQSWCLRHKRLLDGSARAEYTVERVREEGESTSGRK